MAQAQSSSALQAPSPPAGAKRSQALREHVVAQCAPAISMRLMRSGRTRDARRAVLQARRSGCTRPNRAGSTRMIRAAFGEELGGAEPSVRL